MSAKEDTLEPIAIPKRGGQREVNIHTRTIRTTDRRYKPVKAPKPVQVNLKVPSQVRDAFEDAFASANASSPGLSKAKFLALLVSHWNESDAAPGGTAAIEQVLAPKPTPQDVASGRVVPLSTFVTDHVMRWVDGYAGKYGWTHGAAIENLMLKMRELRAASSAPRQDTSDNGEAA